MKGSPLFHGLAPEEVDLALSYFQRRLYPQGKPIFYQGDLGQALYLVASGKVRLFRTHLGGQERTLALLGPGELFGEMSLLDEGGGAPAPWPWRTPSSSPSSARTTWP